MSVSASEGNFKARAWRDRWTLSGGDAKRGGQGTVRRVSAIDDGRLGALKELRANPSTERRYRMQQEVNALAALNGRGFPRVLDENISASGDAPDDPFIVMEWVEGRTLADLCGGKPMELDDALTMADALIESLERMHGLPIYHRDLKPDNIMLSEGDPARPIIVDLGMAWSEAKDVNFETPAGQELGNRSLRLPEFAPGQTTGRDPRSDVTMLLGVLFFAVTGRQPRVLTDEHGLKPHERKPEMPASITSDPRWPKLRGVFTIGFEPEIANRFQSATVLRERLRNLAPNAPTNTREQIAAEIEAIEALRKSTAARQIAKAQEAMRAASNAFQQSVMASLSGSGFACGGTGPNFGAHGRTDEVSFFMVPSGSPNPLVPYQHLAVSTGGVVELQSSAGGRTPRAYLSTMVADIEGLREAAKQEGEKIAAELLTLMKARLAQQYK